MYFYKVLVRLASYHGQDYLVYHFDKQVSMGTIVTVQVRSKELDGIIIAKVSKPDYSTKPIVKVLDLPVIPMELLKLTEWLRSYYPAPLGIFAQQLIPVGFSLVNVRLPRMNRLPKKASLTAEQTAALSLIKKSKAASILLHGDTGTGKTRVYLELASLRLAEGKSVLLLTPEIGLIPQLVAEATSHLRQPIIILHSRLTPAERSRNWQIILGSSSPVVVIGTRSALFAPLCHIGLVIIDECHDYAYKQEQAPCYQTVRVAARLAGLHKARLVLGSATPPVQDYFIAKQKGAAIVRLTKTARLSKPPLIELVDLRQRNNFSQSPHLSNNLLRAIQAAHAKHEQSLLFLNRRGSARLVLCQSCGWQALCPQCDTPLTYHGDIHTLSCHLCNYQAGVSTDCPSCGSATILFSGAGTKTIVAELGRVFPEMIVQRFDADNLKAERFEQHYQKILGGEVDVVVGTQLITKGIDLPRLSVVGVILADGSLNFPDYTAEERTFQLLQQIIGRVGRGHRPGQAIIQTYHPASALIQTVINKDWDSFYASELAERQKFGFPPFWHLLNISFARASATRARSAAQSLADNLHEQRLAIVVLGPTPRLPEKSRDSYHWHLVVKAKHRGELIKVVKLLPGNCSYDLDPVNLL